MQNKRLLHFTILSVVCVFAFFLNNGSLFVNIMEARNFVTARDMLEHGSWLIPNMNGELRLAKPPFPTWITAIFGGWFGIDNISMLRFPAGIMGSLLVFFAYSLSFELHKNRTLALIVGFVLATTFYVFHMGRTGTWDIYCHSFMVGAIWLLVKAWQKEGANWKLFLGAGLMLGLSFLSKGPVAFYSVLFPFLVIYITLYGGKPVVNKWRPLLLSIFVFLVISFWWPVYIYFMHPEALAAVAKLESGSWMNRHVRPFWYYWNFPIQSGIWTLFVTTALLFPYGLKRFQEHKGYKLALIWTLASVFLLSLLPEKKDRYLLPVLIPSAFIVAYYLNYLLTVFKENKADKWDKILFGVNVFLIVLVTFAIPFALFYLFYLPGYISLVIFILLTIVFEFLCVLLIGAWKRKDVNKLLIAIGLLTFTFQGLIMPHVGQFINKNPNFRDIREVRQMESVKSLNFYSIGKDGFRIELVWEIGRNVTPWDFEENAELPENKAFVVLSSQKPEDILPTEIKDRIEIEVLDYFDNNRTGNRARFQKYLSVIRPKSLE